MTCKTTMLVAECISNSLLITSPMTTLVKMHLSSSADEPMIWVYATQSVTQLNLVAPATVPEFSTTLVVQASFFYNRRPL